MERKGKEVSIPFSQALDTPSPIRSPMSLNVSIPFSQALDSDNKKEEKEQEKVSIPFSQALDALSRGFCRS